MAPKIDKQIKLNAMSELDGAPRLYMGVEAAPTSPLPWILKIYERELSHVRPTNVVQKLRLNKIFNSDARTQMSWDELN